MHWIKEATFRVIKVMIEEGGEYTATQINKIGKVQRFDDYFISYLMRSGIVVKASNMRYKLGKSMNIVSIILEEYLEETKQHNDKLKFIKELLRKFKEENGEDRCE
jgi:hypothetical protein